jgi:L-threonylcarbamoyladenylate synthase
VNVTLSDAIAEILNGGIVALPTETVYGLGARADWPEAVAKIYAQKQRPSFNPLIAHVASFEAAQQEGVFDTRATRLAEAFWPGSLTLIVPVKTQTQVCPLARAGLSTVGLRVPRHLLMQAVLEAVKVPIVAPSANPSTRVSPTEAAHIIADFGAAVPVLDGGCCEMGVESTIIACLPDYPVTLLRAGAIAQKALEEILGAPLHAPSSHRIISPGQTLQHYAPRVPLRYPALDVTSHEVAIVFGNATLHGMDSAKSVLSLSVSGNLLEAAHNLFGILREAESSGAQGIAVVAIPEDGLGAALNDRLRRASTKE